MSPVLCALGVVQLLGLIAAGVARLAEGTRHERAGHWLCLVAAGGGWRLVWLLDSIDGPDSAAMCAVTLALMTMIAIVDVGGRDGG